MSSENSNIESQIKGLPDKPGVYRFYDKQNQLIYIGKAKSLKKRVGSYFSKKKHESGKTLMLVKNVNSIKYVVVDTEFDALFLENALIKKHQPKFNIQLKDDKSYPWICIKNEPFPRVFSTRNLANDGSLYFGPYGSVKVMNALLNLITGIYQLRNCNYDLSQQNIAKKKFRVCLEYQIGNCKGPCEGKQTEANYNISIDQIKAIIKGNIGQVIRHLKSQKQSFADAFNFEAAHYAKRQIQLLERYQSKSTVVNPTIDNVDVFSIATDSQFGYVNYMRINKGTIVQAHTIELKKKLEETESELLQFAITELRKRFQSDSRELYLPFHIGIELPEIRVHVPVRGDKKKLLDLSFRNVKYYMLEKSKREERINPERHSLRIMETIQRDLRLAELPRHIECFDNSNFQGSEPVAACVVFRNAKPCKKEYRHFNIKTVDGPDDFASMHEVIYRRYSRLKKEGKSLPQLLIVDGGKGQLSSAVAALEAMDLYGEIAIVGIAKKLEEIYFPGDSVPVYLDKRSESLKVIQHLRNEAHRFGITHHRKRRAKATVKTELTQIPGIGKKIAEKLLMEFKSVKRVKAASEQELKQVLGSKKGQQLATYFARYQTEKTSS